MVKVYIISNEKLGDRIFEEIPVAELQIEADGMTLDEFQQKFNTGSLDARTQFIRFVSI